LSRAEFASLALAKTFRFGSEFACRSTGKKPPSMARSDRLRGGLKMRAYLVLGLAVALSLCVPLAEARAQPGVSATPFVFTFDENGNGFINGSPVVSGPGTDFSGHPALLFDFPSGVRVTSGDVEIREPGSTDRTDGLRFENTQVGSVMAFYSNNDDGTDSVADVGLPGNFMPAALALETTPEGANSFVYIPISTNDYLGTSDGPSSVPEIDPGMMAGALTVLTGGVLALRGRRRRS
jgi:hypothetical protein